MAARLHRGSVSSTDHSSRASAARRRTPDHQPLYAVPVHSWLVIIRKEAESWRETHTHTTGTVFQLEKLPESLTSPHTGEADIVCVWCHVWCFRALPPDVTLNLIKKKEKTSAKMASSLNGGKHSGESGCQANCCGFVLLLLLLLLI